MPPSVSRLNDADSPKQNRSVPGLLELQQSAGADTFAGRIPDHDLISAKIGERGCLKDKVSARGSWQIPSIEPPLISDAGTCAGRYRKADGLTQRDRLAPRWRINKRLTNCVFAVR